MKRIPQLDSDEQEKCDFESRLPKSHVISRIEFNISTSKEVVKSRLQELRFLRAFSIYDSSNKLILRKVSQSYKDQQRSEDEDIEKLEITVEPGKRVVGVSIKGVAKGQFDFSTTFRFLLTNF